MFANGIKLKVKTKSLAIESKIIKKEVQKLKAYARATDNAQYKAEFLDCLNSLTWHNKSTVKYESRSTHLAIAFLNCVPYKTVEQNRHPNKEYDFRVACKRAIQIIKKYRYKSKFNKTVCDTYYKGVIESEFKIWIEKGSN